MKYAKLPTITPSEVYEAQMDGYKFIRLSEGQAEWATKAGKKLYSLEYETDLKKVTSVGVYVRISDLIDIAMKFEVPKLNLHPIF